jgi:N-acetylneuraminic acid mutarotase
MGGSNITPPSQTFGAAGQPGIYGTQGTPSPTNIPGGREQISSWIDASANVWLFGGEGIDLNGVTGELNDLWKFDPTLGTMGEWTWMGGCSNSVGGNGGQSGIYGTLGMPASSNIPGGRDAAVSWTDASGNIWLFGGFGADSNGTQGYLNDLWRYTPGASGQTGEWTWMGGSSTIPQPYGGQSGVYGTLGIPASANIPGGRFSAASWTDTSGNLWLFGGDGFDSTGTGGYLNDLWEYTPATGDTGQWTWISGSNTVGRSGGQVGVYGTLGTAASTNGPGGRFGAVSWIDASGNLWFFGGDGYDSTGAQGYLNDLWKFQP